MNLKKSKYALISDVLEAEETLVSKRMFFSTRKGMGITISNYVWSLVEAGNFTAIPDNLFNVLMYHELIVPEDEDELEEIITRNQLQSQDTSSAELSIYIGSETALDERLQQTLVETLDRNAAASKKKLVLLVAGSSTAACLLRVQWLHTYLNSVPTVAALRKEYQLISIGAANVAPVVNHVLDARVTKVSVVLQAEQASVPHVLQELRALQGPLQGQPTAPIDIHLLTTDTSTKIVSAVQEFQDLKRVMEVDVYVQLVPNAETAEVGTSQEQELAWLDSVSTGEVCLNLLPTPKNTYFATGQLHLQNVPGAVLKLDHVPLEIDTAETIAARTFYDTSISALLRANQISCSTCVYLPLCGGRTDKSGSHDQDCPSFVQNFMKKVELKYNIVRA